MRKIVSLMHMSLDAFTANSKGEMNWIKIDQEVFDFVERFIDQSDTGFYGPITFQMMESYWPTALHDPESVGHRLNHARWYDKAKKVVFSRKLNSLDNPDAKLIKDNLVDEVTKLKESPGKDIIIFGSPRLVHSLAKLGLIDEYVLTVSPVIIGGGIPMFDRDDSKVELNLLESTQFKNGCVGYNYKLA